jgi:hypothetical protein
LLFSAKYFKCTFLYNCWALRRIVAASLLRSLCAQKLVA